MHCAQSVERIALLLDGSLAARERRELEEHLAGCGRCRAEMLLQQKIREALAEEEMVPVLAADFTRRVCRRVRETGPPERRAPRWPRLVPVAALVTAAAGLLFLGGDLLGFVLPASNSLAGALTGPISSAGEAILGSLRGASPLTLDRPPVELGISPALVNVLLAILIAGAPVVWGFQRIASFLSE